MWLCARAKVRAGAGSHHQGPGVREEVFVAKGPSWFSCTPLRDTNLFAKAARLHRWLVVCRLDGLHQGARHGGGVRGAVVRVAGGEDLVGPASSTLALAQGHARHQQPSHAQPDACQHPCQPCAGPLESASRPSAPAAHHW